MSFVNIVVGYHGLLVMAARVSMSLPFVCADPYDLATAEVVSSKETEFRGWLILAAGGRSRANDA